MTIGGENLLIDPFITPNELAKDINVAEIKPDYILITHGHEDHVADVELIAKQSNAKLIANYEIGNWFEKKGLEDIVRLNISGVFKSENWAVKMVSAAHSSSMPDGSYGGQPGGFVIEGEHKNIYIAGDTALTYDMKLIPLQTKLDLAILPIGDNFTMGIDDAILASDFIECDKVLGYHFDTFGYIEIDHETAKRKFFEKDKDLMLLEIGEFIEL